MKSTDGGKNWTSIPFNSFIGVEALFFVDSQTGWAVNAATFPSQKIMKSTDGGETWEFQTFPTGLSTATRFNSIFFTDNQNGWAVGSGGAIIHTSDGGETWTVQESGTTNPSTVISFEIPNASSVNLEVFDILGRKVATLVSGQLTAGTHQVTFDASNLASGVYLYRIQADNFVQTRKLTLLK
ncbi:MAG: YCF48-related protein [Balneolaceae bacterium]